MSALLCVGVLSVSFVPHPGLRVQGENRPRRDRTEGGRGQRGKERGDRQAAGAGRIPALSMGCRYICVG